MECRPAEKAIETILARGYLSRIAVSASDCLSLDNPHFERSSSLALHLPSTIHETELCSTLVRLKTSASGSVQFHPSMSSFQSKSFSRGIKGRSTRFVSIALSLSLHRLICGRARSQTIGRRSPIPYLSPLLDLMAADNWLQVGPRSSIRGVHAWNRSSFTRPSRQRFERSEPIFSVKSFNIARAQLAASLSFSSPRLSLPRDRKRVLRNVRRLDGPDKTQRRAFADRIWPIFRTTWPDLERFLRRIIGERLGGDSIPVNWRYK